MAVLYITEYAELGIGPAGRVGQMPKETPIVEQTVAIGAGSVQSSAFNAKTRFIRVHTDAICSVLLGANPTASATTGRMAAGQTEYRDVSAGSKSGTAFKIAVITNT
jgi:hypothetical protein